MNNIFSDIKTAVGIFGELRRARENGAESIRVNVQKARRIPVVKLGYWGFTMEGSLFFGRAWKPIADIFDGFPEEVQHALTHSPDQPGGWVERAQFWQRELRPVLPEALYHEAMLKITHWYAHCKRMRSQRGGGSIRNEGSK